MKEENCVYFLFGHGLLFSSIIFGGNTLPQKRLNASSPPAVRTPAPAKTTSEEKLTAAKKVSAEKLKTCEELKAVTKTEDDILSEETCEENFVDADDKPTVFEKVHCVVRPAVEKRKRSSKSKERKKKSCESDGEKVGEKKNKSKNKSKNNSDVPSAENDEAPKSDEKNKKKKKKKKSKSLLSKDKDATKKQIGVKDSKEKMDSKETTKDLKTPTSGNSSDTDAKLKALKGKE
uniref:Uncharacterized protein n=1 Tax=Panagrolaimus sp. ES5 TaxID=591445 RepID=A0AC34FVL6_9BILA